MKLVRIARKRWEVLGICDSRNHCQVLEFLAELKGTTYAIAAEQMSLLLKVQVAAGGPPKTEPLCKSLGDGLYELRRQPKGKKLRVLWFYGGGAVIVCSAAFTKAERTPRTEIERARALRKEYLDAKRDGRLEISDK